MMSVEPKPGSDLTHLGRRAVQKHAIVFFYVDGCFDTWYGIGLLIAHYNEQIVITEKLMNPYHLTKIQPY